MNGSRRGIFSYTTSHSGVCVRSGDVSLLMIKRQEEGNGKIFDDNQTRQKVVTTKPIGAVSMVEYYRKQYKHFNGLWCGGWWEFRANGRREEKGEGWRFGVKGPNKGSNEQRERGSIQGNILGLCEHRHTNVGITEGALNVEESD